MKKSLASAVTLCSVAALLAAAPAGAQTAATPLNDPASIVTVQVENDALSVPGTDRYYTAGQRLSYVTPTGAVPDFIAGFGNNIFGDGSQRLEFNLQQVIFTPANTQAYNPDPHDRPYAGQITLQTSLIQDTGTTRSIGQISLGLIGPLAQGQTVQNGFHGLIGDKSSKGWGYQLRNEPTLDFLGGRIWRYDLTSFDDGVIGIQALPQMTAQIGNTEIYAQGGAIIRIGSGLDSDFGPAVIQPAMSGTDAYTPTQPFVWYIFGGALGRVVAHNTLVQGNNFTDSRGVPLTPLQGDLEIGGAFILYGVRVTATEVFESAEFHHQAPAFQYGSVAISARF